MNRPNTKKTVFNDEKPYKINPKYVYDLEKYCDELEKTLDKAYKELELSNKQLIELDGSFLPMTKEQWKEYLLKDE